LNGLRLLGIIVVSFFLIVGGLLLLMGTMCAFNGYQSSPPSFGAGLVWTFFLVVFLGIGGMVIASLVRGIRTSELSILDLNPSGGHDDRASEDGRDVPPASGKDSK
jgi:hypothetical protein